MSDKTREVYKEVADVMPKLNPFVEFPRMRVETINKLNDLIEKGRPMPMTKYVYSDGRECACCPRCDHVLLKGEEYEYCPHCGQRYDNTVYGL